MSTRALNYLPSVSSFPLAITLLPEFPLRHLLFPLLSWPYLLAVLIFSYPLSSSLQDTTFYSYCRNAMVSVLSQRGLKIDAEIETSEIDELTLKRLVQELYGPELENKPVRVLSSGKQEITVGNTCEETKLEMDYR
jgi:hypothetical protein